MAYMNQEKKAKIAANLKPILAKYGMKGTLRVHHHSTIVLTLQSGPIDFGDQTSANLLFSPWIAERFDLDQHEAGQTTAADETPRL